MAEPQRGEMPQTVDVMTLVRDMRDQILREMHQGFKGVHHRQDQTNGRIQKLEDDRGRHDERIEDLEEESESFHQHRRATDPKPDDEGDGEGDNRRLTQRDARLFVFGAGAAVGLFKLLPWLVSLAQAGK